MHPVVVVSPLLSSFLVRGGNLFLRWVSTVDMNSAAHIGRIMVETDGKCVGLMP